MFRPKKNDPMEHGSFESARRNEGRTHFVCLTAGKPTQSGSHPAVVNFRTTNMRYDALPRDVMKAKMVTTHKHTQIHEADTKLRLLFTTTYTRCGCVGGKRCDRKRGGRGKEQVDGRDENASRSSSPATTVVALTNNMVVLVKQQ